MTALTDGTAWKGKEKISGSISEEHEGLIRLAKKFHSSLKAQILQPPDSSVNCICFHRHFK